MANTVVLITPPGLLSFPTFFTPKPPAQGAEPRFSGTLIFDEAAMKTPEWKALADAIKECALEGFGKNVNFNTLRFPIRKSEEKEHLGGYAPGTKFLAAWTKNRPGVVDGAMNEVLDPNAVWAGQVARFSVSPFSYNNSGNKGVSLGLRHVQLLRMDMPRLDGRGSADSDFGKAALPQGYESSGSDGSDDVPF